MEFLPGRPIFKGKGDKTMPLTYFLGLLSAAILAAAATLALAFWANVPLVALGLAALMASLIFGVRQWR